MTKNWHVLVFSTDDANGHVQFTHRQIDGYYDDSSSESDYLNGKLQYYIDDSSDLTFGFENARRLKNSHGAVTGVTAAENDPKSEDIFAYNDYTSNYDVDLQKLFSTYTKDIGENNLMLNLYRFSDNTDYNSSPTGTDPTQYNYANDYYQLQQGFKNRVSCWWKKSSLDDGRGLTR